MQKKIKVLIVDDSALIRALLKEVLESDPAIEVCGVANDPYDAREKIKRLFPDVLTLDIEMPKMNGIDFLKNLMRLRPMPVVMISTLTQQGAPATLQALELGAVDFVSKPKDQGAEGLMAYRREICEKVIAAAKANIRQYKSYDDVVQAIPKVKGGARGQPNYMCAIGASTGGTEAIKDIVRALPENSPPIVVAQHIPAAFSTSFARRLDSLSHVKVFEAEHGQVIEAGSVYIAPGHSHLRVKRLSGKFVCHLGDDEPVNRHRPAVDVLFDSVLEACNTQCIGVLLTGMGADGAQSLLRMKTAGVKTIAQDESTSVVWGMPGAAVALGAADHILAIDKVATAIIAHYFNK